MTRDGLVVLVGYCVVSFGYFGWRLLPHPGRVLLGTENQELYTWSFAWWAHAIGAWTNPLVSHAVYTPTGVDIAWTPSAPGLGLLFAPLTALAGPVASYNVASLLAPALSAWTAYLLCRYLTRSLWASLVGGYLFGFSDAGIRQVAAGNLNLGSVFLFPLVALVVLRYVRGELGSRRAAVSFGALIALQLTISTEFAATLTLALVLALVVAYGLVRDLRPRLRSAVVVLGSGYAVGAVLTAPFVYYLLTDFQGQAIDTDVKAWGTDVLGVVVPNPKLEFGKQLTSLITHALSRSSYLGLPTVAIVVLFAISRRRQPWARAAVAILGVFAVVALGATFTVYGHTLFTLPWWIGASHVPALDDALPFRFGVFTALAAAVIASVWVATTRGRVFARPYVLPVLAVVALVPAVWGSDAFTPSHPQQLAFFSQGFYKSCLKPNETIAVLSGGDAVLAQAEAGFYFKLAGGNVQASSQFRPANAFQRDPVVWDLSWISNARPTLPRLLAFAGEHRVDRVIVDATSGYLDLSEMRAFGKPEVIGGAIIAPACGEPPLTTRNLSRYVAAYETPFDPAASRPQVLYCTSTGINDALPVGVVPIGAPKTAHLPSFVEGQGLTCSPPPAGYKRQGYATAAMNVTAGVYPYYVPA